jgi:hypothetical protein
MEFIEEVVVDDLLTSCRCCLSITDKMKNIFEETIDDDVELFSALSIIAPITVSQDDGECLLYHLTWVH